MPEELSPQSMNEIMELVYSGQKVAACKRYIELRDQELDDMTSILEAKKFIEQLTDELKERYPERFTNATSGCTAAVLVCATVLGSGVWSVATWLA